MLREDKSVAIQSLEVVTNPHGELETPSQIREHILALRGVVARWNQNIKRAGRWSSNRKAWEAQRDACLERIAAFEASLAGPHMTVYQLHSKQHVTQFSEEDYTGHLMTQATSPVWVTTWEGRRWWWYLDRFWWDAEGLEADDVQALVLQSDRRKQATLDRAKAGVNENIAKVEELNAEVVVTTLALENLLAESLEREPSVEFDFTNDDPETIASYFSLVLETSPYPQGFPKSHRVAFVPESRQLVVEYDLPKLTIVPTAKAYRYVKSRDAIEETARPATQARTLYAQVVAQTALRTLHELFRADREARVETIVLNCFVDTIDPATGQPARPCLITVRTSREAFEVLNLRQVDASACLRGLSAAVSRSPHELLPVRPILDFNMVDPRFIEETDVLGELDDRPNLMELSPKEFEALISNLFEKMGLDTRQTQASRDGGVDCVAWDHRPILGGKVVIQAKRYKNTVGVSAVRDLFGTMQNEGASKGILVTTSGYGRSSFDFAEGKPLELLSGSNLLYLLAEHAGIEARIEPPDDWVDPVPDTDTTETPVSQ